MTKGERVRKRSAANALGLHRTGSLLGRIMACMKAISMPRPEYPQAAKGGRATGRILVEVTLNEQGKVIRAQNMCGGSALLINVSENAAKQSEFKPVLIAGKPIRVIGYTHSS